MSGLAPATNADREALLRSVPFFATLDRVALARLVGALEEHSYPVGSVIVAEDEEADGLYLLKAGRVAVVLASNEGERELAELEPPAYFGELGLFLQRRTSTVRAQTEVEVLRLPRERFEALAKEMPTFALSVAGSAVELLEHRQRESVGAPKPQRQASPAVPFQLPLRAHSLRWRFVAGALALALPAALWSLPAPPGLGTAGWHILLVTAGAALGWFLEPVPDFVVALLMVAGWGVTGLAPLTRSLAGFTAPSWIISVGSIALAAAMARSGLLFRFALFSLRVLPKSYRGQALALLLGGLVVTPLVPLGLARIAAVAPLTEELADALHCPPGSRQRAGLAFAGIAGHGLFSSIFLSDLVMNFFVLELLPASGRAGFGWWGWLVAAAPLGAVLLLGLGLTLLTLFGGERGWRVPDEIIATQQRALGRLSRSEVISLAALFELLIGLLIQPFLQVGVEWLAIGCLAIVVGGGVLDRSGYRAAVDWGFLTLFGVLLGAGGVLHSAGVDRWLGGLFEVLGRTSNPAFSLLLLAISVYAIRLVLPWIPATLLISLAVVPVAPSLGISPWLAGFVVLVAAICWLHPNQSDLHRVLRQATKTPMFTTRQGVVFGVTTMMVMLLAIAVNIPYWWATGLLDR